MMIHISFGISTYIGVITLALIKETSRVNLLSSAYVNNFFSIILVCSHYMNLASINVRYSPHQICMCPDFVH